MKTGLNLQPINEPIVKEVMEKYNFTKLSPAINYIIQEYDKLTKQNENKQELEIKEEVKQETKTGIDYSSWFIAEEK